MNDNTIRHTICQQREKILASVQHAASLSIQSKILTLTQFQNAHTVALYVPTQGEIDVLGLMTAHPHKQFLLPRLLKNKSLAFAHYQANTPLTRNRFGIEEPDEHQPILAADALDLILVPLVAFDTCGNRLGRGAGYYDRTLAFMLDAKHTPKPYLIGVAYEFQKVSALTTKPWDVPLHQIITEKQTYYGTYA